MSEKSKKILQLAREVPLECEIPDPSPEHSLLEVGMLCVLARRLTQSQAEKSLKALVAAHSDWNELRVSQIQEFSKHIATKNRRLALDVARDVKTYLQEVFQNNHGFDIEFLREDLVEAGKFLIELEFLGASAGHLLLWHATGGQIPATPGIVRTLDRLGLYKRTSSMRKAQEGLNALVPEKDRREFALRFGRVVEHWCDAKRPSCWECALVESCAHGLKVRKDWQAQQKRLAEQRKREAERRRKELEKVRRKAELETKRRAAAEAKRQAKEERERKRLEARKAKEEERKKAAKKREAEKAAREAARKKAAQAKKKAATKKKPAKKKSAKKKSTTKKTTKKAAKKTTKKVAKKKATKKKATKKKAAKQTTGRKTAKKVTRKKPATKKKAAKKTPGRKTAKKTTRKRTGSSTAKRKSAKKKTTKRTSRRR